MGTQSTKADVAITQVFQKMHLFFRLCPGRWRIVSLSSYSAHVERYTVQVQGETCNEEGSLWGDENEKKDSWEV